MNRRRWALLSGAAFLVAALVGGRWSAMQTAERAWAATLPHGAAYLHGLALARTVQWIVVLAAVLWGVGHCYLVYRAIGSVQMPRRVGDIEIVEAVPHRLLLTVTLVGGVIYGGGLAWAIGDVWRQAVLAASPPHFGVTDSVLHFDLGYYVGELPWARTRQGTLLLASLTATLLVATLYASIGSLRIQGGRVAASPHARTHLGLTLAALAVAFLWGALLDPAETVTGLAGPVTLDLIGARASGANVVFVVALITAALSAAWGWWDRPGVVGTSWAALLVTMLTAYLILPPGTFTTKKPTAADLELKHEQVVLDGLAFGAAPQPWIPSAANPLDAAATIPLWDPMRIRARAAADSDVGQGVMVAGVRLEPSGGGRWLVGLSPDPTGLLRVSPPPTWEAVHEGTWSHAPGALVAREVDSSLTFARAPAGPRATWFGAGFPDYAVVDSGATPGIPIRGGWRRIALAWALQAPELTRAALEGRALLWRRDAVERFSALAPFAHFEAPSPAVVGDSLWWLSWGSVEAETFPLVDTTMVGRRTVRYRQPGLVAALNAVSGATRLWLSPQTDSLTAAWARIVAPLVEPSDSIPGGIRNALQYPEEAFGIQSRMLARTIDLDTLFHWQPVAADAFALSAPGPDDTTHTVWLAQAYVDSATRSVLGGILAGAMSKSGPRLRFWSPKPPQIPLPLYGDRNLRPGVLRVWPADALVLTVQARFWQPQGGAPAALRLDSVYVSLGTDTAVDATARSALQALLRGPDLADGSPATSLRRARALVARMDSALAAGRISRFGQLYDSLRALLRGTSRAVVPSAGPR